MSFFNRVRFLFGIVFVLVLVAVLTLYLLSKMSVAQSSRARLAADSTTVGSDYAGLITKQNIEEGSQVTKGQELFEINSLQFETALDKNEITLGSLPFTINSTNKDIIIKATSDGVMDKISFRAGAFIPAGGVIATINTVGSLHVVSNFSLSPPDYARINKNSPVFLKLPDNTTKEATIFAITLVANGDTVDTVVKARLKDADISDFRFSVGTPVQATLQLSQEPLHEKLLRSIEQLFKPAGQ